MESIFSPAGRKAVSKLATSRTLYGFDFDGTLTPYFTDPDAVFTPPDIAVLMKALCRQAKVAVVTGRALESLGPKLKFRPHYQIGNHGVDGLASARGKLGKARAVSEAWLKGIRAAEKRGDYPQGVWMEDKVFSLTFHYRSSRNTTRARRAIDKAVAGLSPRPRIVLGKYVCNLLPPGLPHKGHAMRELMKKSKSRNVFFLGDDVTDEDVFRGAPASWLTVRVGYKANSAARFYVPRFADVPRFLKLLLEASSR